MRVIEAEFPSEAILVIGKEIRPELLFGDCFQTALGRYVTDFSSQH